MKDKRNIYDKTNTWKKNSFLQKFRKPLGLFWYDFVFQKLIFLILFF